MERLQAKSFPIYRENMSRRDVSVPVWRSIGIREGDAMTLENQMEKTFIDILTLRENQWTYRGDIKTEAALWENLRGHINRINLARLDGVLLCC